MILVANLYLALLVGLAAWAGGELWRRRAGQRQRQADREGFWQAMAAKRFTKADRKEIARELKVDNPALNHRERRRRAAEEARYLKRRARMETGR